MFDNSGQIAGWSGADAGVSRALVKMEDYLLMTAMPCPSYVCMYYGLRSLWYSQIYFWWLDLINMTHALCGV